jgi:hypothetical protein
MSAKPERYAADRAWLTTREMPTTIRKRVAVAIANQRQKPVETLTGAIIKKLISKTVWKTVIMRIATPRAASISRNREAESM